MTYVAIHLVASIAGISVRAMQKACTGIVQNTAPTWRGSQLIIRQVHGRGGRSGLIYEVRIDSLPADLQEACKALQSPVETPSRALRDDRPNVASWRLRIITPALFGPDGEAIKKGTAARAAAIRTIVATTNTGWDGKAFAFTNERLVQRWLKDYEEQGITGLMQKHRKDKGTSRVVISRRWFEKARVWFDTATISRIDFELKAYIRSLITATETPGRTMSQAGLRLKELSAKAGMPVDEMDKAVFKVPRPLVDDARQKFGRVAVRDHDAKAYHDLRPSTRRKLADSPVEFDLDAMHFDHVMRRDDGTEAYPKAIVAVCRATHRLFVMPFLLQKGEGIRQEHVAIFQALFEAWGVPQRLTIDNGSEFRAVKDLTDIIQLVGKAWGIDGRIINAQAYNARAKVVENAIGVLQRVWLSSLPGHVGNNRINRKTQQVGRPTAPFPGDFDLFTRLVQLRVQEYNEAPQRGKLAGRSPNEVYQSHIDDGFALTKVDRASLIIAFSKREVASVGKFGIRVGGQWWTCDELHYRSGQKVGVLKGRFRDWPMVPLFDLDDENTIIGYAAPNEAVDGSDPANAREQKRRERLFNTRTRELKKAAPPADIIADTIANETRLPPPPQAPVDGTIVPNPKAAEIVAGMLEAPEERQARRASKIHSKIKADLATAEKFSNLLLRKRL